MEVKKIFSVFLTLVMMSAVSVSAQSKKDNIQKVDFKVNMTCEHCKMKIEKNIAYEKGVKDLVVNLDEKTVAVTYDTKKTDVAKLQEAFNTIGYQAEVISPEGKCCKAGEKACADKADATCCKGGEKPCADKADAQSCCSDHKDAKACKDGEKPACEKKCADKAAQKDEKTSSQK